MITHYRSWQGYTGNNYEGRFWVKKSALLNSQTYKNNLSLIENNERNYDEIIFRLKENDKNNLQGVYHLFDSLKAASNLSASGFAEMIVSFVIMIGMTVRFYFGTNRVLGNLPAMCYGMLVGSVLGFVSMVLFSMRKLKYSFWSFKHTLILIQSFAISIVMYNPILVVKILLFGLFIGLFAWGVSVSGFVRKSDFNRYYNKFMSLKPLKR